MQEIIASVDHIKFDLEIAVEQQLGAQPLPFPGMDSERGGRGGWEPLRCGTPEASPGPRAAFPLPRDPAGLARTQGRPSWGRGHSGIRFGSAGL